MASLKFVKTEWEVFRAAVFAAATPDQREALEMAFYGGASAMFHGIMRGLSAGPEADQQDITLLSGIEAEIDAYAALQRSKGERRRA